MLCFHIEAAFHQSCDPLTTWCSSSLHSKPDAINSGNIWNSGQLHSYTLRYLYYKTPTRSNLSSKPCCSNHILCMTTNKNKEGITDESESKKGNDDWFSRITSKKDNNKDGNKKKKAKDNKKAKEEKKSKKTDGGNGNWFSRVSRKVFSKSPEEETEKKRDLFLKGRLGQASTLSNRDLTDIAEENEDNNKNIIWPSLEKEIQEKQEMRRKELFAELAIQREESKKRYDKQMQILQRNKAIAEAASSDKKNKNSNFFIPLFPQNATTTASKSKISKKDDAQTKQDKIDSNNNATKATMWGGVTTNVANFASNIWVNTITKASTKSKTKKEEWITVCPKTRISPNQIVPVVAAGLDLLLVASKDGKRVYCIANSCPHLGTPLDLGTLERREKVVTPPSLVDNKIKENKTKQKNNNSTSIDNNNMFFNTQNTANSDGCEDCIVCPLHRTAFALQNGEVRGEWCPYPPVVGKLMGTVKTKSNLATFEIRVRGKNIEVRISSDLNSVLIDDDNNDGNNSEKKNFLDIF